MSGSNGRRGSSIFQATAKRKANSMRKRRKLTKFLRVETLERRELMAFDVEPHHNNYYPADVNRDFHISPLDALIVVNALNTGGSRALSNEEIPADSDPLLDVSNDGFVSPIDALMVINKLNLGEGAGERVKIKYEFFDENGVSLDRTPSDGIAAYTASLGQKVLLRASVQDTRTTPSGLFAVYHDLLLKNDDGTTAEKLELQWGEYNLLRVSTDAANGSTFKIRYGTEETQSIALKFFQDNPNSLDVEATRLEIESKLAALGLVGGTANVDVESVSRLDTAVTAPDPTPSNPNNRKQLYYHFGIKFIGTKARQDIVDPLITNRNVFSSTNAPVEVTIRGKGDFDQIRFGSTARTGSFRIRFGSDASAPTTDPIQVVTRASGSSTIVDTLATSNAIRNAVAALTFVGGGQNVTVDSIESQDTRTPTLRHFAITFASNVQRKNFGAPTIVDSTLVDATSNPVTIDAASLNNNSPSVDSEVFRVGLNFDLDNPNPASGTRPIEPFFISYNNVPSGFLANSPSDTFVFDNVGALANRNSLDGYRGSKGGFFKVFEATMVAAKAGTVSVSGRTGGEVLLFGENTNITDVEFQTGVTLSIVANLQALNNSFTVAEDSGLVTRDVASDDVSLVGAFGIQSVTQPTNGGGTVSVVPSATGKTVDFTPAPNFFGQTTFTYTIQAGTDTSVGTVTVTVTPDNDPPQVVDNTHSTDEDIPLVLTPTTVFNAGPGETSQTVTFLSAANLAQTNGNVALVNGNVVYTPTEHFFGTALFTVTGTDDNSPAATTTTTVTVTVNPINDAPTAFTGTLTVAEDNVLTLIGAGAPVDLLSSSSPGPNESQTVSLASISATTEKGGTIATTSGVTRYTPPNHFFGTDTFTYAVSDGALTSPTATVTINVTPVNDGPDAVDDTAGARFTAIGLINLTTTIDPRRNDSAGPLETNDTLRIVSVGTGSQGGSIVVAANGQSIQYTPADGKVSVEESFTYTIEDSGGLRDTATAVVFIVPPVLPFAIDDTRTVDEDSGQITIDVLADDLANNGATKSLISVAQPASGGTVTQLGNSIQFTPNANVFTPVTFTYVMNDSAAGSAPSTATVTILFNEINDVPSAINRTFNGADAATEDVAKTIAGSAFTTGLSKGPLEDSQSLVVSSATPLTTNGGTVVVENGNVVYTPAKDFNGEFRFTYTVQDNGTTRGISDPKTATATATLTVNAVNDPPEATNDSASTTEDTPLTITLTTILSNDRPGPSTALDETGNVSFVSAATTSAEGGTIQNNGQTLVYTPKGDFNGSDRFTYTISDGNSTAVGTVSINVTSVNDAPRPTAINLIAYKNINREYDLTSQIASIAPGPNDESSQTVTLSRVFTNPNSQGTISLNAGRVIYTPKTDFVGVDTLSYEVVDNGSPAASAVGSIVIDVQPFVPSDISGFVWVNDNNKTNENANLNIVADNELRVVGARVRLTGRTVGESTDITPIEKLTLADGSYRFEDLPPGIYTVSYIASKGLLDGPDFAPTGFVDLDGVANNNAVKIELVAPGGTDATDLNFAVLGVDTRFLPALGDNSSSSYLGSQEEIAQRSILSAIASDGSPLWTLRKKGVDDSLFVEVSTNANGLYTYAKIDSSLHAHSFDVPLRNTFRGPQASDFRFVQLVLPSVVGWSPVDTSATARGLRASLRQKQFSQVDAVFAQEGW